MNTRPYSVFENPVVQKYVGHSRQDHKRNIPKPVVCSPQGRYPLREPLPHLPRIWNLFEIWNLGLGISGLSGSGGCTTFFFNHQIQYKIKTVGNRSIKDRQPLIDRVLNFPISGLI